jgi:nitronate monooxygenase
MPESLSPSTGQHSATWNDRRFLDLVGIEIPIIQAPMAGSVDGDLVVAVSEAGGLGSLPCAMLDIEQTRSQLQIIRQRTSFPINVNFFCHESPQRDPSHEAAWAERLRSYYVELGLDTTAQPAGAARAPFDESMCDLVAEFTPEVVSFHFGLPQRRLLDRVRGTGAKVISTATCVQEARWLEDEGCDAIITQGYEAGGHRGMFLTQDITGQVGTMALVPQVADAVRVPVIAAGGIGDARGIVAAFALGASAAQIGTAYLFCPEAKVGPLHRSALRSAQAEGTALTNVFTGRPARSIVNRIVREVGPMSDVAPHFPLAAGAIAPMRKKSEEIGSADFIPLWSGQAAALGREIPAGDLTRQLAVEALERMGSHR